MSKLSDAITRVNQQVKTMSKAEVAELHKGMKTSRADLMDYQKLQSHAFAMGKISYEDAQLLYRIYGGEGVSTEHWDKLSLGEKVVGTKAAAELIDMRLGGRKSPRNPFGKQGITDCPMCRMEVYVKTHESRSEALRRHLHRVHAGHKKGDPGTGPFLDQYGYPIKENPITNELYRSFHGYNPTRARRVTLPQPKGPLLKIGRLTKLEYAPEGRTEHKTIMFYHVSGDTGSRKLKSNTILATDKDGKNFFLVKDDPRSKYPFFSDRGIIG
jgi:hypothetical protein